MIALNMEGFREDDVVMISFRNAKVRLTLWRRGEIVAKTQVDDLTDETVKRGLIYLWKYANRHEYN